MGSLLHVLSEPKNYHFLDQPAYDTAKKYIRSNSLPNILTIYTSTIDGETHYFENYNYGSIEEAQLSGLSYTDTLITELVKVLKETDPQGYQETLFFLIADHGHTRNDVNMTIDRKINFPEEVAPGDLYRIKTNSYMAHLYIKNGEWPIIPTSSQIESFMINILPFATFHDGRKKLIDYIAFFVTRDKLVYRNWNGEAWEVLHLMEIQDKDYGFVDGARRIENLLHHERAGDVILVSKRDDKTGFNIGFSSAKSTHGSLWPDDTYVTFYVWGQPLNKVLEKGKPVILKDGNIVDLTPTVMSYLNIYDLHKDKMDGRPLFDKNLSLNLNDFEILRDEGKLWDILFGRMVLAEHLTR